jgi:hypothetical protein
LGRTLGELEHVGALGVLGALAAFGGGELAVGVYLAFEAFEELVAAGLGAGAAVAGARPRDVGGDPLVDVGQVCLLPTGQSAAWGGPAGVLGYVGWSCIGSCMVPAWPLRVQARTRVMHMHDW